MSTINPKLLPVLAIIMSAFIWGSAFIAMKVAVMSFPPPLVIFWRMLVGCLVLMPIIIKSRLIRIPKRDWPALFMMALCEPVLYFILEGYGMRLTTASQAGMVAALLPVMIALSAWFFLGEKQRLRTWCGFISAVGGVVWLTLAGSASEDAPNPVLGNFLEFLAMICAVGYMMLLKRLSASYSPWFLTAVQAGMGCLFYTPALFFFPLEAQTPPLEGALAILYLGALVTTMAYGFYNYGMSRMPASQAGAFTNLIPVFALVLSWAFLGETLSSQQLLACGLVLVGVVMSQEVDIRRPSIKVRKPRRPLSPNN